MIPLPIEPYPSDIPWTVNLIWVGSPPPVWVRGAVRRWREHLDQPYDLNFWTDKTIVGTPLEQVLRDLPSGLSPRAIADILRLYAVSWYGGWYFDVDLVLLKALPTNLAGQIFSDSTYPDRVASNGAFGFCKGHPFLAEVLAYGQKQWERGVTNEHFTFGPRAFHAVWETMNWIPFEPSIPLKASEERRRIQFEGRDFDMFALRAENPDSTLVHIGLPHTKEPR